MADPVLRATAILNAFTVLGHAQMGFKELFPVWDKIPTTKERTAAKVGWTQGCGYYALSALLFWKIAETRASKFEKLAVVVIFLQNVAAGTTFYVSGDKKPLLSTWGSAALVLAAWFRDSY